MGETTVNNRRMTRNSRLLLAGITLLLFSCFLLGPTRAHAQCFSSSTTGFNVVYGPCNSQSQAEEQPGFTLVDATQYTNNGNYDICQSIQIILSTYSGVAPGGVVVDARGFNPGTTQNCSINPYTVNPPSSVVLLPSGTITIFTNWTLPKDARVIGEGGSVTTLSASTSFTDDGSGAMIEMGTASLCAAGDCPGISIEHLALNGNGVSQPAIQYGILNAYSQELGYVRDVSISNVTAGAGTGLSVQTNDAANSGVYWDLKMTNVNTCVSISGTTDTRGVHGLNCTLSSTSSGPGISINAPNNSLEDIYISGSGQDGILIGAGATLSGSVANNIILNVAGKGLGKVIHISNQQYSPPQKPQVPCAPYVSGSTTIDYTTCNTTILGVVNLSASGYSIADDLTGTNLSDAYVGMYILGDNIQAGNNSIGFSRLTTGSTQSTTAPTWIVGTTSNPGTCGTSGAGPGAIYSEIPGGAGTKSIYICSGGTWTAIE